MPISPTPTPPGLTSPSFMCSIGIMPPIGVMLSCMQLTEPFDVPVVVAAHRPHVDGAEAHLLALHVPADDCVDEIAWSTPSAVERRGCRIRSATIASSEQDEPDAGHHGQQHPGLLLVADHDART